MRVENGVVPTRRIFVGNIPNNVSEDVLRDEFSGFGNVDKIELKTKGMGEEQMQFAFVTLSLATDKDIDKCLKHFARNKFHGESLRVQVARENFMDRLKREWGERDATQSNKTNQHEIVEVNDKVKVKETQNNISKQSKITKIIAKESSSSSSDSSSDSEPEEDKQIQIDKRQSPSKQIPVKIKTNTIDEDDTMPGFISKKNAESSLQNGKIKIKSTAAEPIHVIYQNNKIHKTLEGSAQESDKKRKESLHKMKKQYDKQKLAIKEALSNIDSAKKSSKIIFDDDYDDDSSKKLPQSSVKVSEKKDLFNDSDDGDEESEDYTKSFEIKKQFQGEKGAELLKLQSKFKLDPRFAMDTRFLEDNDEANEQEPALKKPATVQDDERKLQFSIIEQIVGKKINTERPAQKKPVKSLITRFDPTKEEHKKFYKSEKEADTNLSGTVADGSKEPLVEVSTDRYYKVSDDLKEAVLTSGKGFSLLAMLGRERDSPERTDVFQQYMEIPLANKSNPAFALDNPFKYDSSDSENDGKMKSAKPVKNPKSSKPNGMATSDLFFLLPSDKRLEEGADFFKTPEIDPDRDYDEIKRGLSKIINRKIAKKRKHTEGFKTVASKFKKSRKAR